MLYRLGSITVICFAAFLPSAVTSFGSRDVTPRHAQRNVKITVKPVGSTEKELDVLRSRVLSDRRLRGEVDGAKQFILSLEAVDNGTSAPTQFQALVYNYGLERTLLVTGDTTGKRRFAVKEVVMQPVPSDDEFEAALDILRSSKEFGEALQSNALSFFRPMPPVSVPEGTMERLVNIGLRSDPSAGKNEIVSVSIKRGSVIRYPDNAPPTAVAGPNACGITAANQTTSSSGMVGQYQMTVSQGNTVLWEMLVVRPSASSGNPFKRSAIEVRNVKYMGASVLKRGHVPILNVEYPEGQCGPYRDWQYQEDMFQTPETGNIDPAPGIRILPAGAVATTAIESGNDTGNFRGVAIYTQNDETVLVSELQAGWYRYISEWRFANDGTIRPRFGFGSVDNSCVCFRHHHHVYWRLDFDIVSPSNRVYLVEDGPGSVRPIGREFVTDKNIQTNRRYMVRNSAGPEGYLVVPNETDGIVDPFGVNDVWLLAFKGTAAAPLELEDGVSCVSCTAAYIQMGQFVTGESIVDRDIVFWYGAHFLHDDGLNSPGPFKWGPSTLSGDHVVGPDLVPVNWYR